MKSDFEKIYNESIKNPEEFWKKVADDMFWFKKPLYSRDGFQKFEFSSIVKSMLNSPLWALQLTSSLGSSIRSRRSSDTAIELKILTSPPTGEGIRGATGLIMGCTNPVSELLSSIWLTSLSPLGRNHDKIV